MFCKNCGLLLVPINGKYHCRLCDRDVRANSSGNIKTKSTGRDVEIVGVGKDSNLETTVKLPYGLNDKY